MKNMMTDQADGLRRLMAGSAGRRVAVLGGDSAIDVASVTLNLAAALVRQGREVQLLDEYGGTPSNEAQPEGRLVLINARLNRQGALSPLAAQADYIVVALQPNAASITQAYACIKRLHQAHALQRLRLLLVGATDETEAQRILSNLAHTGQRYLALTLESAGCVRADPFIAQARQLNLTVVEAFRSSPAATDFCRIAGDLLNWPLPRTPRRKPVQRGGMLADQAVHFELATQ